MYWNGHFNLDDLCDQFPLDTFDRDNVRGEILQLFKKYLSNSERPDYLFNKIRSSQGSIGVCRIIWPNETVLFKCNDCQYDDTCAICINCFLTSSHMGHSWSMSKSYGGCCDCGDVSSWKLSGSCYRHQGITSRQDGPKSLVSFSSKFYNRAVRLVSDIISFIDDNILNSASLQHKFSSILLDILKELANLLHGLRWIINNSISCRILSRWIKRHKDLDLSLQKSFGLFYLAMFASPRFKVKFSKIFANSYFSIITPFPKLLYDNTIFNMAELSVQLLTVPEIAISFAKLGFINTCLRHLKKLFNTLTDSPVTHGEFIAKGFLHECTHICTDLSFLLNHREVSKYVIEDSELHSDLFGMLSSYNYVNSQVLHLEEHIEIQNTLYPLTFIIEDGIIFALRPLWLNLNRYMDDFGKGAVLKLYLDYFNSVSASISVANSLQNINSRDGVYLCRTFHIPLLRLLPNIVNINIMRSLFKEMDNKDKHLVHKSTLHILDQCIKCHLFYLEIKGGIWVRNGDSMYGQNEKYRGMGFLDRDLSAIQMSALIINMYNTTQEYSKGYNFLHLLVENCFPYVPYGDFIDFIRGSAKLQFGSVFESHYYKYVEYLSKCFFVIICRFVSNVAQLVSSNWDLTVPLIGIDGDNSVKYFLFKMDVIHYIHFDSTKVADLVKYVERRWPNGNLFKLLEQIGTVKSYGNGDSIVTLKSEYLTLVDMYWPGDFNFDENLLSNKNLDANIAMYPDRYLSLHNEVVKTISGDLMEILQVINSGSSGLKVPSLQIRIINTVLAKIGISIISDSTNLTNVNNIINSNNGVVNGTPKRSSQLEALLALKRKQLNFISKFGFGDDSDEGSSVCCILCHSSGDLDLLCYQMPLSHTCKRPTFNNFYPLYKCLETCGHSIHKKCLETYITNKRLSLKKSFPCPLCKLQVNLTIPYISTNSTISTDVINPIYLEGAFVSVYWELLVAVSFKRNLLISNHATMLVQLMKHQYRGSVISVDYEIYNEGDLWQLNPLASLLKFIFTNKPSKLDILQHVLKLTSVVVIQLLLDDFISNNKDKSNVKVDVPIKGQYFRLSKRYKSRLSLKNIFKDSINNTKDNNGFICGTMVINRVKILPFVRMKICKSRSRVGISVNFSKFLPNLLKLLKLVEDSSSIESIVSSINSSFGTKIISRLSDFLSLCLWSIHFIFPYTPDIAKRFAHEHLITNPLERFNLLWSLLMQDTIVSDLGSQICTNINEICKNHTNSTKIVCFRPRFTLEMFKLAKNSDIIPRDYMRLLRNTMCIKCILCNSKPSSPVVCLFCCKWICLFCRDGDRFMGAFDHAAKCSFGSGCFFLVHQRKVLYVCCYTRRFAYVDSIYSGPFGTFKENLTSNSPLELSRSRLVTIANDLFFNRRSIKWQQIRLNLLDEDIEM